LNVKLIYLDGRAEERNTDTPYQTWFIIAASACGKRKEKYFCYNKERTQAEGMPVYCEVVSQTEGRP
jgi:hypothetical protein